MKPVFQKELFEEERNRTRKGQPSTVFFEIGSTIITKGFER